MIFCKRDPHLFLYQGSFAIRNRETNDDPQEEAHIGYLLFLAPLFLAVSRSKRQSAIEPLKEMIFCKRDPQLFDRALLQSAVESHSGYRLFLAPLAEVTI